MAGKRGGAALEEAEFAQTLGELKRRGSNVLLVGAAAADAHGELCGRLCGDAGSDPRYRLHVTDERTRGPNRGDDREDPAGRTIDCSTLELAESGDDDPSHRTPLGALGIEVIEAIDAFDADADGLDSAELRLCIDSLVPLLEEHEADRVFRLLHMMTSRVVHVQGMGHYHLPLAPDHDAVRLFEPLFDAVVEVRDADDGAEQRWRLRDEGTRTEWLPL